MGTPELHDIVADRLREASRRCTGGSREIQGGSLPQRSAYRDLTVLEQAGAVHRIVTSADSARYELAEVVTEHRRLDLVGTCGACA